MTLITAVTNILCKRVTEEQAKQFALDNYGVLATYIRGQMIDKIKKSVLLILLLFSLSAKSQENYPFVSVGFDVANAIAGSKPTNNKSSLDAQIKAGAVYKSNEVYIQYENFNRISFQQYGLGYNRIIYPFYKVDLVFGVETGSIVRGSGFNWLYYGGNIELRYDLTKKLQLSLQGNYRSRKDIEALYNTKQKEFRGSGFINIIYKIGKRN